MRTFLLPLLPLTYLAIQVTAAAQAPAAAPAGDPELARLQAELTQWKAIATLAQPSQQPGSPPVFISLNGTHPMASAAGYDALEILSKKIADTVKTKAVATMNATLPIYFLESAGAGLTLQAARNVKEVLTLSASKITDANTAIMKFLDKNKRGTDIMMEPATAVVGGTLALQAASAFLKETAAFINLFRTTTSISSSSVNQAEAYFRASVMGQLGNNTSNITIYSMTMLKSTARVPEEVQALLKNYRDQLDVLRTNVVQLEKTSATRAAELASLGNATENKTKWQQASENKAEADAWAKYAGEMLTAGETYLSALYNGNNSTQSALAELAPSFLILKEIGEGASGDTTKTVWFAWTTLYDAGAVTRTTSNLFTGTRVYFGAGVTGALHLYDQKGAIVPGFPLTATVANAETRLPGPKTMKRQKKDEQEPDANGPSLILDSNGRYITPALKKK
jgi:hypothetical protein